MVRSPSNPCSCRLLPLVLLASGPLLAQGDGGAESAPGATSAVSGVGEPEAPESPAPAAASGPGAPAAAGAPPGGARSGATPSPLGPGPASPPSEALEPTAWEPWWAHNRLPFLQLAPALESLYPETRRSDAAWADPFVAQRRGLTHRNVYAEIVPALLATLEARGSTRLVSASLLALGRIGEDPRRGQLEAGEEQVPVELGEVLCSFLTDSNLAVREAALVGLGALASHHSVAVLAHVLVDDARGRELVGGRSVPTRERALAAYSLGLAAARSRNNEDARYAAHHLARVLDTTAPNTMPELEAACVGALGVLPLASSERRPESGRRLPASSSRDAAVEFLLGLVRKDKQRPHPRRLHAPVALARLAQGARSDTRLSVIQALVGLATPGQREPAAMQQSAILALGLVGDAGSSEVSTLVRETLMLAVGRGDQAARAFSLVSLALTGARRGAGDEGLVGAEEVERHLVRQLVRGKSRMKPWAGLALGVLAYGLDKEGQLLSGRAVEALHERLGETRSPRDGSAYSLAIALVGDHRGRVLVQENLERFHVPSSEGATALALGMFGNPKALAILSARMEAAREEPELLTDCALARALIGDRTLVSDLLRALELSAGDTSAAGVCQALGWTGDASTVRPLLDVLRDTSRPGHQRAAASRALGWIADPHGDPLDAVYSLQANYLAEPGTAAGGAWIDRF